MTKKSRDRRKNFRLYIKTNRVAREIYNLTIMLKDIPPQPTIPEVFTMLFNKEK